MHFRLKERGETEKDKIESAFRELYNAVWLPRSSGCGIDLEKVDVGACPLGTSGIHERLMELLTSGQRKVHGTLMPHKLVEYMRTGEYADAVRGRPLGIITLAGWDTVGPYLTPDGAVLSEETYPAVDYGLVCDKVQSKSVRFMWPPKGQWAVGEFLLTPVPVAPKTLTGTHSAECW